MTFNHSPYSEEIENHRHENGVGRIHMTSPKSKSCAVSQWCGLSEKKKTTLIHYSDKCEFWQKCSSVGYSLIRCYCEEIHKMCGDFGWKCCGEKISSFFWKKITMILPVAVTKFEPQLQLKRNLLDILFSQCYIYRIAIKTFLMQHLVFNKLIWCMFSGQQFCLILIVYLVSINSLMC